MSYNTYVINLEKDKEKYNKISRSLKSLNIKFKRFNAIYGRDIENKFDKYINSYAKLFLPRSLIGCSLSHLLVTKKHFKNSNNIALILEDDSILQIDNKNIITQIIKSAPKNWDIILFYTQGITNYRDNTWNCSKLCGSTCAYLINKSGYEKLYKNYKILGHCDIQRILISHNNPELKIYKTPQPVVLPDYTSESSTSSKNYIYNNYYIKKCIDNLYSNLLETNITGITFLTLLKYKNLRIPYIGYELDSIEILLSIITFYILLFMIINKKIIPKFLSSILLFLLISVISINILDYKISQSR